MVFGDLNIHEVYVNNLVFYTGEINGVSSPLTKADFEQYRDNGMPQNIFDELTDDNDFAGPILSDHSSLTVNDKDVEGFYNRLESLHNQAVVEYDRTHPFESKAQKTGRGKAKKGKKKTSGDSMDLSSYMFVYSAWTKRSFYELEIYEDFDIDRLRVEVSRDELHLGDHPIYTFSLSYETQNGEIVDFSFRENHGTNSDSSCLYDTKGKAFNFEIIEGDDDDENGRCDSQNAENERFESVHNRSKPPNFVVWGQRGHPPPQTPPPPQDITLFTSPGPGRPEAADRAMSIRRRPSRLRHGK